MSYKIPKLTDKRKLCPRCGAPMMDKSDTLKYCPVCHFSESSMKTAIVIKTEEDAKAAELPKIELIRVSKGQTTKVTSLDSDYSFVIVDRNQNILWIWRGAGSSAGDAYKAGVETTKLKSSLKMYSAQIKRVEEGDEPDIFPSISVEAGAVEAVEKREEEEKRLRAEEEARKQKMEEERKRKEAEEQKRREEAEQKRKEEEGRRQAEAEKKKAEEEQKQKEEERRQAEAEEKKAEEEQKRKEEEQKIHEEELRRVEVAELKRVQAGVVEPKPEIKEDASDVWKKVAKDTKATAAPIEKQPSTPVAQPQETVSVSDDKDLNEAISSLTLVRGINEQIATALYKADITTIMELSLGDPEDLAAKSGLELSIIREIVGNAKDLLGFD